MTIPKKARKKLADPRARRIAKRAKRRALSTTELERLKEKCRRVICSGPWWDYCSLEADAQGIQPVSTKVPELLAKYEIYPPLAENTPMRKCRCRNCGGGRLWPAYYITNSGYSVECAYDRMRPWQLKRLQGSTSKINLAKMKAEIKRGQTYQGGF